MKAPIVFQGLSAWGLSEHTNAVREGDFFFSFAQEPHLAEQHALEALQKGASAVISAVPLQNRSIAPVLVVENPRLLLSQLAAAHLGPIPPVLAAVTGTNGKTSTAHFVFQLWKQLGLKSASVGTLGLITNAPNIDQATIHTTPEPITLYKLLNNCFQNGVTHGVLEASSHGLAQHRIDHLPLQAAAFTQLGRDHLDYHASLEEYLETKKRLFTELLPPGKPGVVFMQNPPHAANMAFFKATNTPFTVGPGGDNIRLVKEEQKDEKNHLLLAAEGQTHHVALPILGTFQAYNILTALGIVLNTPPFPLLKEVLPLLERLHLVPGRLEKVAPGIYIDYAHTPDALEQVLTQMRALTPHGRLILVFGCGGGRDLGKRAQMGALAQKWADIVIVTDDNPRFENPENIRAHILESCPKGLNIGERQKAIEKAISILMSDRPHLRDNILIAGKGAETEQNVNGSLLPFSDKAAVKAALLRWGDNSNGDNSNND